MSINYVHSIHVGLLACLQHHTILEIRIRSVSPWIILSMVSLAREHSVGVVW